MSVSKALRTVLHAHRAAGLTAMCLLATASVSLAAQPPTPPCHEANTPFQQAYAQQQGSDVDSMNLTWHTYRFTPAVGMTVCSIGYRNSPANAMVGGYRFQIVDLTSGPTVILNQTGYPRMGMGYLPVPPTPLAAGHPYELRRKCLDNNCMGPGKYTTPFIPIVTPNLTIDGTRIHGAGTSIVDGFLPDIDFGIW